MRMDADLLHSPAVGLAEEEEADMNDWKLPLAFMKKRHSEKIEGSKALAQSWRMKDRLWIRVRTGWRLGPDLDRGPPFSDPCHRGFSFCRSLANEVC
ncbi:putative regulatory-associated protein of mTOR [Scophthalmus maximus]|uniref:Putative regulatory-associated protein of mTOR n=1 Tax=Scophthalmus maximus TaxID=52904 RepID=A0A2U9BQ32_SCOMX|nr:putative regulatory-associated protein of mTOR [Scophthalmus maximus]